MGKIGEYSASTFTGSAERSRMAGPVNVPQLQPARKPPGASLLGHQGVTVHSQVGNGRVPKDLFPNQTGSWSTADCHTGRLTSYRRLQRTTPFLNAQGLIQLRGTALPPDIIRPSTGWEPRTCLVARAQVATPPSSSSVGEKTIPQPWTVMTTIANASLEKNHQRPGKNQLGVRVRIAPDNGD